MTSESKAMSVINFLIFHPSYPAGRKMKPCRTGAGPIFPPRQQQPLTENLQIDFDTFLACRGLDFTTRASNGVWDSDRVRAVHFANGSLS